MKRLTVILLCLLLLCGCGAEPSPETATTAPATVTEAPTEPEGLYDPTSSLEDATGGAIRVYALDDSSTQRIMPFGDDLLLIANGEQTRLTRLSGDNLNTVASVTLDCPLFPGDPSLRVGDSGVTYYRDESRELIILDETLRETARFVMPENILCAPAVTQDQSKVYYFTEDSLRVLDLQSGIDSLLKEIFFTYQSIRGLHCNDTVIECDVGNEGGDWMQMFLSTEDGSLVYELLDYVDVHTYEDQYFAVHMDGEYEEKLIGRISQDMEDLRMLHCPDRHSCAFPVLEQNAVVTSSIADDRESFTLDYYDLRDGSHPYSITLPLMGSPFQILPDATGRYLWILYYDDDLGRDQLLRWDLLKSAVADDTVYIGTRRTVAEPDTFGLEQCAREAEALSEKYGVQILTWTDAIRTQPFDYSIAPEHQVVLIRESLQTLDQALSHFPEGFFADTASQMGDGVLRISLARAIFGYAEYDTLDDALGLQFWDDNFNAFICLKVGPTLEQNLYHELFHVMESRIISHSSAFDNWMGLNPEGFEYDYNYSDYLYREDISLVSGEDRAFIDGYCMSYPKEDRARIMEYAMMPGYEFFFESQTMQAKLRAICDGIREAFGLEDSSETFLWEQYLMKE